MDKNDNTVTQIKYLSFFWVSLLFENEICQAVD